MGQGCCNIEPENIPKDYTHKTSSHPLQEKSISEQNFSNRVERPKINTIVQWQSNQLGVFSPQYIRNPVKGIKCEPTKINKEGMVCIYIGEEKNKKPHGKGELFYPDQSYYIGYFDEGICHGLGRFISPQGWFYEGEFKNDKAEGKGVWQKRRNCRYEGYWENNLPHGFGKEEWIRKKVTYEGYFISGKKQGEGQYKNYKNPAFQYNGTFKDDNFHSFGIVHYQNGDQFRGIFEKGKRHGKGTYKWRDGSKYQGYYKSNLKHGKGEYCKAKNSLQGQWVDGQLQGKNNSHNSEKIQTELDINCMNSKNKFSLPVEQMRPR